MAIKGQDAGNDQSSTFAGGQVQAKQEQVQQPQTKRDSTFSWNRLHTFGGHTMARSPIGEALSKTITALNEQLKGQNVDHYEVRLIPMDMKDFSQLPTSVILVCLKDRTIREPVVAVHVLILEGSVEPWGPKTEMIGGASIEVQYPTSEAYKSGIDSIIGEELSRHYPGHRLMYAEGEVVPRTLDLTNERSIYNLAANSLLAVESRLFELQEGRSEINVAHAMNDASLSVRLQFTANQDQQLDSVDQPLRSDIELALIAVSNNQNQQQYGQQLLERQRELGYVTGYIDTIWDPVQNNTGFGAQPMQFGNQVAADGSSITSKIRGVFVITDSRIQEVSTITAQVFSLFPACLLRQQNQWQAAFRPRAVADDGAIDLKNVGALNLEVNLPLPVNNNQPDPSGRGQPLDVNSANFNPEMFNAFMQATFRSGLGIAMDIPECGSSTWYNSIFNAAALGKTEAYNMIYDATDYLTNGGFSKIMNRGEPIVSHFSVIHNGWYTDKKGKRRDIRDFDLVALLNHPMGQDRQVIDAWINSFQNQNVPIKVRLHDRFRIISKAFSEVHLTGFSNRVFLTDKFLTSALAAAAQAGLVLRPQNQLMDQGIVSRVSANLNSGLFGMGGGQDVFNNSFINPNQQQNNFNSFGGMRFGGWNTGNR